MFEVSYSYLGRLRARPVAKNASGGFALDTDALNCQPFPEKKLKFCVQNCHAPDCQEVT